MSSDALADRPVPGRAEAPERVGAESWPCAPVIGEAIEAREVIERAIVRLAALRRTDADLERMRTSLRGMRTSCDDAEAFSEFDFELHLALSDAARNQLLAGTLAALHELVRDMIALFATSAVTDGRMDALVESHADLVDAIERQEPEDASRIVAEMMALLRVEAGRHAELVPG